MVHAVSAGRRFFFIAFLGSIIWIAMFSYLMVWWASTVSSTLGIPPEVSTTSPSPRSVTGIPPRGQSAPFPAVSLKMFAYNIRFQR